MEAVGPEKLGAKDGDFAAMCQSLVACLCRSNLQISPYTHFLVYMHVVEVELFFFIYIPTSSLR